MYSETDGCVNENSTSIQFSHLESNGQISKGKALISNITRIRNASNHSIRSVAEDRNNPTAVAGYNVTNLIQGIGILGIPYAVLTGSWIALVMIFVMAFIACTTGMMIIDCLYDHSNISGEKRVRKTYSCIAEAVWPRFGRQIVTAICLLEMFGANTLYIILLSVESNKLFAEFQLDISIYYCSLIFTYSLVPLLFITRVSIISWFSMIAVFGLFGTIATIITYCFYNIRSITISNFPSISPISLPLSLGIITFSYCAHAAFPGIESGMKYPSSFNRMVKISFSFAAILKFLLGFLFVLIFGNKTMQQCSLNIENHTFSVVMDIFILINTFFSVPLVMYVITERIDDMFMHNFHYSLWPGERCHWYWLLLTRTLILTMSLFTAMIVPHFALMMGFVGSFTGTCITFIFPCIFSLKLRHHSLSKAGKGYRLIVIALGIILGLTGCSVSLMEIIQTISI